MILSLCHCVDRCSSLPIAFACHCFESIFLFSISFVRRYYELCRRCVSWVLRPCALVFPFYVIAVVYVCWEWLWVREAPPFPGCLTERITAGPAVRCWCRAAMGELLEHDARHVSARASVFGPLHRSAVFSAAPPWRGPTVAVWTASLLPCAASGRGVLLAPRRCEGRS